MPMVLNSLMVGDWKSLLSNFGGTGPVPITGRALLEEEVVGILGVEEGLEDTAVAVEEGLEDTAVAVAAIGMEGERLAAKAVVVAVVVAGRTEGEGVGWTKGEGLLVEAELEVLERAEAIEDDERDCACLARFLAAAFVCQPHEQRLFAEEG